MVHRCCGYIMKFFKERIMKMPTSMFLITLSMIVFSCTQQKVNPDVEKAKITEAIHNAIGWAKNKDFNVLYGAIANDSNYLEVQPSDRVVRGFEEFKKGEKFWGSPHFKAIRYDIRDLKINISNSGDVAWYYCILDDINEWKGQPANWENTRWTGVLEKRNGNWVIVQMHFSFAEK